VVSPLLVARLKHAGILIPVRMVMAAQDAGLNVALAAAILIQESGGGQNIFGHDPTIYAGAGEVTETKYHDYLARRGPTGAGGMQGVGPCQLTFWSIQDAADRLGGCWKPLCNMREGFQLLAENIRRGGLEAGVAAYNGEGPAADGYAATVLARARDLAPQLHTPAP
jgi:hypothetical protein